MEIQITNYRTTLEEFNQLSTRFPQGKYKHSNGSFWFNLDIPEQNGLALTWFLNNDGCSQKMRGEC